MLVTLTIIASKAVGFLREMVAAHYFGTQPEYDAYVAAYALFYIPVLLLNSCITSTLVPMYTEARARRGLARADRFASNAINILALIALGVTVLMLLLAGPLVRIVYSGYEPWKAQLTAELVRVMVLTLAFNITSISLASLLNAQEKYIAAQITGFPLSFAIILAAALFARTYGVRALAWGVFAANILQTLVLVPFMRGWFNYRLIVDFRDRRFRHLLALAGPAVLSMAVSELNHMVDQWRASYGNAGDVSALSYGYKVITLLTGVVIVPLTTIMFSRMSRMVAENDRRGILGIVRRSTVTIAMVMTPIIAICAVIILAIGAVLNARTAMRAGLGVFAANQDVIKALYLGGQFDLESAAVTAGVFLFYVIGVLGFGLRDLLNRTFHAMQDTSPPGIVCTWARPSPCSSLRHRLFGLPWHVVRRPRHFEQHLPRAHGRARPGAGHHHIGNGRHAGAVLSFAAPAAAAGHEAHRARYGEDLPRLGPDGAGGLGRGQPHARGGKPHVRHTAHAGHGRRGAGRVPARGAGAEDHPPDGIYRQERKCQ